MSPAIALALLLTFQMVADMIVMKDIIHGLHTNRH